MRSDSLAGLSRRALLGLSLCLVGVSLTWASDLVLHDNFDASNQISPDKWFGTESWTSHSTLESSRFVANGELHLSLVGYGRQGLDQGRRTGTLGLGLVTQGLITALQAKITITHAGAQDCSENVLASQGRAQLVGHFFNVGRRPHPGDLTDDVVALIENVMDSKAGPFIRALVVRCTSKSCAKGDTLKALLFKVNWTLSQPTVLRIEWEPEDSQFAFTVNPGATLAETRRIVYDPSLKPQQARGSQRLRLRARTHGANCPSKRRGSLMDMAVDDVYLRVLDPQLEVSLLSTPASPLPGSVNPAVDTTKEGEVLPD